MPKSVGKDRGQVQAGLDQGHHLVPGLEHLAAVDALMVSILKITLSQSMSTRPAGMPSRAILPPWFITPTIWAKAGPAAAHFQTHVKALGHAEFGGRHGPQVFAGHVHGAGHAHLAGQTPDGIR